MASPELAEDLITLAGGPSILGVVALLTYLRRTLSSDDLDPKKGWLTLAGGVVLLIWLGVFLIWALPTVLSSWSALEHMQPVLWLLSATWLAALVLVVVLIAHAKAVCRYLVGSYRAGEGPWPIRLLRRWVSGGS